MKNLLAAPDKATGIVWLLSLGLHGLVLLLPMPSEPPIAQKPVRVVSVSRQPIMLSTPKVLQKPTVARSTLRPQPKAPQASVLPVLQKTAPNTSTLKTPAPTLPTPALPAPTPSPVTPPAPPNLQNTMKNFSEQAKPGCKTGEDCYQVADTQWRVVADQLRQKLQSQGYETDKLDDLDDETGMGIYRVVTKTGEKQFLHLLLTDRGTVYMLDPKQLTREQLEQRIAG